MADDRDPTPIELRDRELAEERIARAAAVDAVSEEQARADLRRADKARYLREKLEQQAQADRAIADEDDDRPDAAA